MQTEPQNRAFARSAFALQSNLGRAVDLVGLEGEADLEGEVDSAKEVEAVVEDLAVEATVVVADSVAVEEVGHLSF